MTYYLSTKLYVETCRGVHPIRELFNEKLNNLNTKIDI